MINDETIAEDEAVPPEKRTVQILEKVASYIHLSIRLPIDYSSRHAEGKVPTLDVKMWIEEVGDERKVVYQHYEREMTSKAVIHAKSTVSTQTERTVLSQGT